MERHDWMDAEVAFLRCCSGLSANAAAAAMRKEFGIERTRNAVIGKRERIGMQRGRLASPASPARALPACRAPRASTEVTIFDLRDQHCHWPIGDPRDIATFRFCGGARSLPSSYCAHHLAIASAPRAERRRA